MESNDAMMDPVAFWSGGPESRSSPPPRPPRTATKRSSSNFSLTPRREVIGQLVSHAGALSKMSYDDFAQRASAKLGQPLTEALAAAAEDEFDADAFRSTLASTWRMPAFAS